MIENTQAIFLMLSVLFIAMAQVLAVLLLREVLGPEEEDD